MPGRFSQMELVQVALFCGVDLTPARNGGAGLAETAAGGGQRMDAPTLARSMADRCPGSSLELRSSRQALSLVARGGYRAQRYAGRCFRGFGGFIWGFFRSSHT